MFAQCKEGRHGECRRYLPNSPRHVECNCPCHGGRPSPKDPCHRCGGTGYYGPVVVEGGRCFACGGTGERYKE